MSRKRKEVLPGDVPAAAATNIHDIYRCLRSWQQCQGKPLKIIYETPTHITLQCMGCRLVQRHEKVTSDAATD